MSCTAGDNAMLKALFALLLDGQHTFSVSACPSLLPCPSLAFIHSNNATQKVSYVAFSFRRLVALWVPAPFIQGNIHPSMKLDCLISPHIHTHTLLNFKTQKCNTNKSLNGFFAPFSYPFNRQCIKNQSHYLI